MGSIKFLAGKAREITLDPMEVRYVTAYIVSCECLQEVRYDELSKWKEKFENSMREGCELKINVSDLLRPFPLLTMSILNGGIGIRIPFLEYFEGMKKFSHNYKLYSMVKNIAPRVKEHEIFADIIHHVDNCSVELAKVSNDTAMVWSIFGRRKCSIEPRFVKADDYLSTHETINGKRIAIRSLQDHERIRSLRSSQISGQVC
jgi:hypothetical protein